MMEIQRLLMVNKSEVIFGSDAAAKIRNCRTQIHIFLQAITAFTDMSTRTNACVQYQGLLL